MRLTFPCELAARRVVPSIRAALVFMLKERGYSVCQIGRLLGLTPAAVSQYVSRKRGGKMVDVIVSDEEASAKLEAIVSAIVNEADSEALNAEICSLCELIRRKYPDKVRSYPY